MRSIKLSAGALQQNSVAQCLLSPKLWMQKLMPCKLWCQALLIQCLSLLLIAGVAPGVINSVFAFELRSVGLSLDSIWFWLIPHAILVSVMAWAARMPVWWRWIHVIFPLAVITMQQIALPAIVYLAGFVITLALYWSVHNTRVPFYPSFPATWRAMHNILDQHAGEQPLRVLDIGSGLGDVSLFLSRQRAQDQIDGIEIAPLPWLVSVLHATFSRSRAKFTLGDYRQTDFAQLDVVFAYLSPAVMADVWQKVHQEMRPGSLFISSEFPVADVTAARIIYPSPNSPALYVYTL
ncbi:class I SAM-dependent methyltransferase [Methylophilus flavus]|uniref:Class I SAM-dependent methyltransferase n=1 Tax=Methylophilus flavus TaxID=640084 RepID=A0ABW3P900_9PROT